MGATMNTKPVYRTLPAAAKAYGATVGAHGRQGGWVYSKSGMPLCHGWRSYGQQLVNAGLIDPQDASGTSVRRAVRGGTVVVQPIRVWIVSAEQYVITEG
jgi:hypothetical protein